MCQVIVLRPVHGLVSIPAGKAVYCKICKNVTNSPPERCGKCGSEFVLSLATLIDQPPNGPDSGPTSPGCVVPPLRLQVTRAA
jgi:hypothetical protein